MSWDELAVCKGMTAKYCSYECKEIYRREQAKRRTKYSGGWKYRSTAGYRHKGGGSKAGSLIIINEAKANTDSPYAPSTPSQRKAMAAVTEGKKSREAKRIGMVGE